MKSRIWKDRVTTVFVKQGHYALDKKEVARYRPADLSTEGIADVLKMKRSAFLGA